MKQYFESIFNLGYTQYKGQGTSNGEEVTKSFKELSFEIAKYAYEFGMQCKFKNGEGRWATVPYIRIFYENISPSAKEGVYIVYLFSSSGKSVFLTLGQGTTNTSFEKIRLTKNKIQENIGKRNFSLGNGSLAIGDNKDYGKSIIFYKEYKVDNLPSEDEMYNDLKNLLEIYRECRDKGLLYKNISVPEKQQIQEEKNEISINQIKDFLLSSFTENPLHTRYIHSLLSKPFVILSGNSGTGKTRIATHFAKYLEKKNDSGETNNLLIPIGADWTDNTKILGYYNPLADNGAGKYEKTDVFRFIERAGANPKIPFFLILDEMNLSHVERYFSDFLSKMELLDYKENNEKVFFDIPGYGKLELPKNLFITGTVNIDETTYMFSPKVLDRANVIEFKPEMDDVLNNLLKTSNGDDEKVADPGVAEGFMKLANGIRSGTIPQEVQSLLEEIKPILESFYKELEKCGFEFAYRTVKEIRLYAIAAFKTAEGETPTATDIADIQILQKILPKIHGNKKQIGNLLDELEKLCTEYKLEESGKKIRQMKDKLSRFQYASFI